MLLLIKILFKHLLKVLPKRVETYINRKMYKYQWSHGGEEKFYAELRAAFTVEPRRYDPDQPH